MRIRFALAVLLVAAMLAAVPRAASAVVQPMATYHPAGEMITGPATEFVAADKFGNVWVSLGTNELRKYSPTGSLITTVGGQGIGDGQFDYVVGLACDRWGRVYAADRQGHYWIAPRVEVFDPDGDFLAKFVDNTWPTFYGLAVSPQGQIFASCNTNKIRRWTPSVSETADASWTTGVTAMGLACDEDGNVLAGSMFSFSGREGNKVTAYSPTGTVLASFGETGTGNGQFDKPYYLDVDGFGQPIVAEVTNRRIQVFGPQYVWRSIVEGTGYLPNAVAAGRNREAFVVNMTAGDRVAKYETTQGTVYDEVAGPNMLGRIGTAIEASKKAYPRGTGTVVVATGYNFPDALGGAALCGVSRAPLLLCLPASIPPWAIDEVRRLGAKRAIILGSESAVGPSVEASLNAVLGAENVDRIGGGNRYETAAMVASAAVAAQGSAYDGHAFVATGGNYPDALSASPIAAANGWPIYLVGPTLSDATKNAMKAAGVSQVHILGGEKSVTPAVETALNAAFGDDDVDRLEGADRYGTAAEVAAWGVESAGMLWSTPGVAVGDNFPDALSGGVLQGSDYSVMLLTRRDYVPTPTRDALAAHKREVYEVRWIGSGFAVNESRRADIRALLF